MLWLFKAALILFFVYMFLRRGGTGWGAGLLSVTTALLLDAVGQTWGRDQLLAGLGFFSYVLGGMVAAGAAIWVWDMVRGQLAMAPGPMLVKFTPPSAAPPAAVNPGDGRQPAIDRQMLYEQIRANLGPDDILDLLFDLGISENDVLNPGQDMPRVLVALMDEVERQGKTGALALAVERILTPLPPQNLPRLEKISAESPPTILRQFLIANYDLSQLAAITADLNLDWEEMGSGPKKTRVRLLLQYLTRRGQLPRLIQRLHAVSQA